MKIIYIGSLFSPFSLVPLHALIKSKHTVSAVVYDNHNSSDISVVNAYSLEALAFENLIPVIEIQKNIPAILFSLKPHQADLIVVSCYARHLPELILSIPKQGCINIHPSLLPRFRGPDPVFWQFQQGVEDFGVTIHQMTAEMDAGAILAQRNLEMPDGLHRDDATKLIANSAAGLLENVLDDFDNKCDNAVKQNETLASYQSFVTSDDYSVSVAWSAKRIFNFIKAVKEPGGYFPCELNGQIYKLLDAISHQDTPYPEMGDSTVFVDDENLYFSCQDGYIYCLFKK